jgi:hypothetical protein
MPSTTVERESISGLDMALAWACVIVLLAAIAFVVAATLTT